MDNQTTNMVLDDQLRMQEKKDELERYLLSVDCVESLQRRLENIDDRITTVRTAQLSAMPRGGQPVTIADLIAEKMELEERLRKAMIRSDAYKQGVIDEIDSLLDASSVEILELKYLKGLSLASIAEKMGYSERQISRKFQSAIAKLCKAI